MFSVSIYFPIAIIACATTVAASDCASLNEAYTQTWDIINTASSQLCSSRKSTCRTASMLLTDAFRKEIFVIRSLLSCTGNVFNKEAACSHLRQFSTSPVENILNIFGNTKNSLALSIKEILPAVQEEMRAISEKLAAPLCEM